MYFFSISYIMDFMCLEAVKHTLALHLETMLKIKIITKQTEKVQKDIK